MVESKPVRDAMENKTFGDAIHNDDFVAQYEMLTQALQDASLARQLVKVAADSLEGATEVPLVDWNEVARRVDQGERISLAETSGQRMPEAAGRGSFPTTRWSLIVAAQEQEPESGVLNTLCEVYWYPIYAFIRRQGNGKPEAEDLTQGFFARLLEKRIVQAADPDRGRFRAFLLGSLKHFLSHERERAGAQKRGGHIRHVEFDSETAERLYQQEQPRAGATPEQIFERQWALQLLDSALEELQSECERRGKARLFQVLAPFLENPGEPDYGSAAAELGISVGAARVTVHRLRARYRALLRELIAKTVVTPDLVDDEIRHLVTAVSA